jgi:ribosomal protein L11 methyltransferase
MDWLEVIVPAAAAETEDVAAMLADELEAARAGTEIRGAEVVFWVPLADAEAAVLAAREAVTRLRDGGAHLDPARVRSQPAMPESEWRDAWKKYFHTVRLTRQVVVVPSWELEGYAAAADDVAITLDPGMAFGTGAHASTRLVLEELQRLRDGGAAVDRLIDIGCGSGILAIAAVKLWPGATAIAIDNDPIAVRTSVENSDLNGTGALVACAETPIAEITEQFPLVLANIQAHILLALRDPILRSVAPGGRLVLSGLMTTQVEGVASDYAAMPGMSLEAIHRSTDDPQWSSAVLRRA